MLARLLFTYAKLGYRDKVLFARICNRLVAGAGNLGARDVGMISFAAGRLRLKDKVLLGHLAAVAAKKLPDFTPGGLTSLMWGLGNLEVEVDP